MKTLTKIPALSLYTSRPNPVHFGNRANPDPLPSTWTDRNWLKSLFHFSFAEHRNGAEPWGVLKVLNDDLVQPASGFGTHPHRNMEIITYVLRGSLTHEDSMGTSESLGRGSIQFMTAGSGIEHSEHNRDPTTPLRFIQTWIAPRANWLDPNYGSLMAGAEEEKQRSNQWAHLCSDVKDSVKTPVKINQDLNFFVSELSSERSLDFTLSANRQVYMVCVEGNADVGVQDSDDHDSLRTQDAMMIVGPAQLRIKATETGAHVLLFEMKRSE